MNVKQNLPSILIFLTLAFSFSSCSRMGWGVLLWSIEEPPVLSGTVLPVYIRSNIEQVWVVGVPDPRRRTGDIKIEVPLSMFEFVGSKLKAQKRAEEFSQYALAYAENLQDQLPIRDDPDNSARRVYRLRLGEIVKILRKAEGNPPISTTGDPLPGDWYVVLTEDGITGYCFSYRLKIFDHYEGPIVATGVERREPVSDPDLEMVLSKTWSAESYLAMVNSRQINIEMFEKNYRFDPGQDIGIARIILPDLEREFTYDGIYPDGERAWRFEGSNLSMNLRNNNTLAVQFLESSGARRTLLFASLSSDIDDLIMQENTRRQSQFMNIYNQGPVFTSINYGTITFTSAQDFTWTGYDLLVPQLIPYETRGQGSVLMDLFLSPSLAEQYNGAFTLRLTDIRQNNNLFFLYNLDNQGLRLEVVPDFAIEDTTVTRTLSSPMVLYFYRDVEY